VHKGVDLRISAMLLRCGLVRCYKVPIHRLSNRILVQSACSALPLMVGWFALNLPAGLSLYYFSNTVMTSGQQIFLRKLGGANIGEFDLGPIELGKARRTGTLASTEATSSADEAILAAADAADVTNGAQSNGAGTSPSQAHATVAFEGGAAGGDVLGSSVVPAVATISRRCKRKKRELLEA